MGNIETFKKEIEQFRSEKMEEIEQFRSRFLGKKGILTDLFEEIKKLADDSKAAADDSNQNNRDIKETIERLIAESGRLSEIVDRVNTRSESLVSSCEQSSSSISLMKNVAEDVESSLKQILE